MDLGSRVILGIFVLMFMGSVVLLICSASCVLYSAGSGVKILHVVLSGLKMRLLFVLVYVFPVGIIEVCFCYVYDTVCCGPICLRCLMLTIILCGVVVFALELCCGEFYCGCL